MVRYYSAWIVPISEPPIRNGWVEVERGRVVSVGGGRSVASSPGPDLGSVVILPGLVNAHTHLELSYQRGLVPRAGEFVSWVRGLLAVRSKTDPVAPDVIHRLEQGIDEAVAAGTAVVGDISNTLATIEPLSRSPLAAVVFYELLGFNAVDPDGVVEKARQRLLALPRTDHVRPGFAAHAPYSVSAGLFRAIRAATGRDVTAEWSVHLSESADEVEFLRTGGGQWRSLLEEVGAWNPSWVAPRLSPVEYLDAAGVIDARLLTVHGVQMTDSDLARLAARGATLVTCPRSNAYTGAGVPPIERFYRSGVRVAVGTDSLASTPDLNVFSELAAMRTLAPSVDASVLLESATRQGACALGFGADYGTIEPGKRARLVTVTIPPGTEDVEEYLVSGIRPAQVSWIPET